MNIFFSSRFEVSLKKYGLIARLDFNDWAIDLSNSRISAVRTFSLGPIHLTYINYEVMNNSINEMIAQFEMSEADPEQYIMSELEDINIPKTLN
jgi:hypothetical protein